jgi:hypothetical protein
VKLCLINCFVQVASHEEALWWISRFQELRAQLPLEVDGPEVMLSVSIQYPRGFWLLRRRRDLTRFFQQHFPAAFPGGRRSQPRNGQLDAAGLLVRRLTSVSPSDVRLWCEEPVVRRHIERARIGVKIFLKLFERSDEKPMGDVLEHLGSVLRDHPV